MSKFEVVSRKGNRLDLNLLIDLDSYSNGCGKLNSKEYICGAIGLEMEVNHRYYKESNKFWQIITIDVKFRKLIKDDLFIYKCKLSSEKCAINNDKFYVDGNWYKVVKTTNEDTGTFDFSFVWDIDERASPFASLYDDTDLVDFELHGEGGAVSVHRTVLAASSPVFKTMLCGDWKESNEGKVNVPGVTKEILQQLKDYIYLYKLPETDVDSLMSLGLYYMMPDLVHKCGVKLMIKLDSSNADDIINLAVKYKLNKLIIYHMLKCVKNDFYKKDDEKK